MSEERFSPSALAALLWNSGIRVPQERVAAHVSELSLDETALRTICRFFEKVAEDRRESVSEVLLRLSGLPGKSPCTFENFDYSRMSEANTMTLKALKTLAFVDAGENVVFSGGTGLGKAHFAQAIVRECCLRGRKASYMEARELKAKFVKAARAGSQSRLVSSLAKPAVLAIAGVDKTAFDRDETRMFFSLIDRRHGMPGKSTVVTGNKAPSQWKEFFGDDESLLCMLDRLCDHCVMIEMKGPSYRGRGLQKFSMEMKDLGPCIPNIR